MKRERDSSADSSREEGKTLPSEQGREFPWSDYDALAEGICDIAGEAMAGCEECMGTGMTERSVSGCRLCAQRVALRERLIAFVNAVEATLPSFPDSAVFSPSEEDRTPPKALSSEAQAEIAALEQRLRDMHAPRQAALTSLIERVREFVDKFCRGHSSKTGRPDYTRIVTLDVLEKLRIAFDEFQRFDYRPTDSNGDSHICSWLR